MGRLHLRGSRRWSFARDHRGEGEWEEWYLPGDGELRFGLIEDILSSGIPASRLVFEAPNKELQTYFIERVGAEVNLGNIRPIDVIGLETLRLGLRSDTLLHFEAARIGALPEEDDADA